ncbi:hypothetical protein B0H17DRAFT_1210795 [Mycena rosella]|uniref:Uncharacterized protein n=1 Tax=Mycena rosella TaxID=1033263 RepID=A0AAD7CVQ6_MYCRO|nr:hypothetical protein B0H17DRAFT_1210795 [Mycena rosella]
MNGKGDILGQRRTRSSAAPPTAKPVNADPTDVTPARKRARVDETLTAAPVLVPQSAPRALFRDQPPAAALDARPVSEGGQDSLPRRAPLRTQPATAEINPTPHPSPRRAGVLALPSPASELEVDAPAPSQAHPCAQAPPPAPAPLPHRAHTPTPTPTRAAAVKEAEAHLARASAGRRGGVQAEQAEQAVDNALEAQLAATWNLSRKEAALQEREGRRGGMGASSKKAAKSSVEPPLFAAAHLLLTGFLEPLGKSVRTCRMHTVVYIRHVNCHKNTKQLL